MNLFKKIQHSFKRPATLALAAALLGLLVGVEEARAETLVLGSVGKDLKAEMKEYEVLAQYLQDQLSSSGVDKVEVVVVPTAAKMSEALKAGTVHLYFESPLVAAEVSQDSGAVPMLRRWRKGVAEYWSEILVRSEADIRSLEDLRGHVIALDDPDSTSGHLLPRAMLRERGLDIEVLERPTDPFDSAKVGGIFTQSDKASLLMLLEGRVAAVGTDSQYTAKVQSERPGAVRSLARSITVPRHVVMRSASMPEERAQRIAEILTGMNQSEEGLRVLRLFGKTDRFDAFPQGVEATFAPIKAQLRLLGIESGHATATQ